MRHVSWLSEIGPLRQTVWNIFLISLGCILCGGCINGILIPQKFFGAGFSGAAIIIHYVAPSFPVAALYFVFNIPVFAMGWMYVGRRFFVYSIAGMIIFTAAVALTQVRLPVQDKILSALFGGIIMGVGSGLILRSLGSAGGLDILSVIFFKRFSIRLGTTYLGFNSMILLAGSFIISLEGALYTLIYMFVNAKVMDLVVTGLSQRKAIFIVSSKWQEISRGILNEIHRGVTILRAEGAYTGKEHRIIYSVVTFKELPRLKDLIRGIDRDAFVVVSETSEVIGQRIGNQPHW